MATRQSQVIAKWALAPSVGILSGFAFIPLALVFYYAFLRYNLQDPDAVRWFGWNNFYYFMKDPFFLKNLLNTLLLVGGVIVGQRGSQGWGGPHDAAFGQGHRPFHLDIRKTHQLGLTIIIERVGSRDKQARIMQG